MGNNWQLMSTYYFGEEPVVTVIELWTNKKSLSANGMPSSHQAMKVEITRSWLSRINKVVSKMKVK